MTATKRHHKPVRFNPLQVDPTRTTMLRRQFEADVARRYTALKRNIRRLLIDEDELGLKPRFPANPFIANAQSWAYLPDDEKVKRFRAWLQQQVDQDIVGSIPGMPNNPWVDQYLNKGYSKGFERAYADVQRAGYGKDPGPELYQYGRDQFIRSSFGKPTSADRLRLLSTRSLSDLQGINEAMSQQITGQLVQGMMSGDNPYRVAKAIAERVDKIGTTRAKTLARTETIRAHAEGALDSMEAQGIQEVGVMVEWTTAKDNKVCPLCKPLARMVLRTEEAHGMFPRHPNCRCTPIPANVGESTQGQLRSKERIMAAIRKSMDRERQTRWSGANVRIDRKRPTSIANYEASQPRHPKGSEDGGQWKDTGKTAAKVVGALAVGTAAAIILKKTGFSVKGMQAVIKLFKKSKLPKIVGKNLKSHEQYGMSKPEYEQLLRRTAAIFGKDTRSYKNHLWQLKQMHRSARSYAAKERLLTRHTTKHVRPKMSQADKDIISTYTDGVVAHKVMNAYLKKGPKGAIALMEQDFFKDPEGLAKSVRLAASKAKHLQEVVEKAGKLPKRMVVYRGVDNEVLAKRLYKAAKSGTVVKLRGFQSTSIARSVAEVFVSSYPSAAKSRGRVILKIKAKSGLFVPGVNPNGAMESELLLNHGHRYRVVRSGKAARGSKASRIYYLEEL